MQILVSKERSEPANLTRFNHVLISLTILMSAFLLFQIQLITAKWILPWFGGSPSVWTTCMLFYQLVLLSGYVLAHVLSVKIPSRKHLMVCGMLLLSLFLMVTWLKNEGNPILPGPNWKPEGNREPFLIILQLLLSSIGFPFLLLSTTSPLLQKWVSSHTLSSPYRFYAVSNAGSLLALITYPILIEPNFTLRAQSVAWSAGYVLFVTFFAICTFRFAGSGELQQKQSVPIAPTKKKYALWIGLSACGSLMLLATTNQICRDIAVIPFLWILPLTIYLLTFILCFEHERFYSRAIFQLALVPLILLACIILRNGVNVPILQQIFVFTLVQFATCMICHGELFRSRPPVQYLTNFYLAVAAGGALGGVFSGIAAPYLMKGYWEFHLGLWLTAFLLILALVSDKSSWIHDGSVRRGPFKRKILIAGGLAALAFLLLQQIAQEMQGSVFSTRNFYGVLNMLLEDNGTSSERYTLQHGRIRHGYQFTDPERQAIPTAYYGLKSGIGITIQEIQATRPLHIGTIGLGVGTMAAYGKPGDLFRFYEIDRDVAFLAQSQYFRYLKNTAAKIELVLGDGRISLEREGRSASQNFDLLAIDAFNSDSIPVHLLTKEAMNVYLMHLKKPSGILAFHISNRYLDLRPVIFGNARAFQMKAVQIDAVTEKDFALPSTWVILTFDKPVDEHRFPLIYWTDDYHSILPVMKWRFK